MTKKQIQEWHDEGVQLAGTYLKFEARMVELLSLIAGARGYLYFGSSWNLGEKTISFS